MATLRLLAAARERIPSGEQLADTPGWIVLYTMTIALQLIPAIARALVFGLATALIAVILGWPVDSTTSWAGTVAALAPFAASLATLAFPHPLLWPTAVGARRPSRREQAAIDDAITRLRAGGQHFRTPRRWYILDANDSNASVYGNVIAVHRALIDSSWLDATIAHELGHLNSPDGRVTAAVNRLILPLHTPGATKVSRLASLLSGMATMRLIAPAWAAWYRHREYAADRYAARLGQADELAACLEQDGLHYDQPIPFIWLSQHTHPPTELRIQRLLHAGAAPAG